ncbi:MAG: hypothetical protein FD181_3075, partial [Prolixibacteraceae bacterium]
RMLFLANHDWRGFRIFAKKRGAWNVDFGRRRLCSNINGIADYGQINRNRRTANHSSQHGCSAYYFGGIVYNIEYYYSQKKSKSINRCLSILLDFFLFGLKTGEEVFFSQTNSNQYTINHT